MSFQCLPKATNYGWVILSLCKFFVFGRKLIILCKLPMGPLKNIFMMIKTMILILSDVSKESGIN